ncbi:hypothetical protein BD414DRAFT_479961 [Trametes punicea]|nr:hypothetical protein BD414DRAFT_479961 [Trametes punicea]
MFSGHRDSLINEWMYNETLRRNPHSGHEEPTAKTKVPSVKHERAAPKSHRSQPKPSCSPALCDGLKVLDPLKSSVPASEPSSRCF